MNLDGTLGKVRYAAVCYVKWKSWLEIAFASTG